MTRTHLRFTFIAVAGLAVLVACGARAAGGGGAHPEKAVYADHQSWPATGPGQVRLKKFRPFRAVYDRQYTQASGPGAGQKRQDRVIVTAEEVGWDGKRAVAITMIDSAAAKHADTAMRTLTMVTALDDLTGLFEIGPLPGKAKDYYLARMIGNEVKVSMVMTDTQELRPQKSQVPGPGFGPGSWVMASMKLKEGMKIRLAPYYSPQANPISQTDHGRVIGRETITDGSGEEHDAWVIETSGWYALDHPKVLRLYVKNTPPYYLGTETYNHDTGESSRFVWLRDFLATE